MKYFSVAVLGIICAFLLADFLFGQGASPTQKSDLDESVTSTPAIAFKHALHGDSIGLDCAYCHTGARSSGHAFMPAKSDCMDCHRLPLTENPGIETLDSALAGAASEPWVVKSNLPEHVVFHHGVHSAAGVECADCHRPHRGAVGEATLASDGAQGFRNDIYGGEKFDMKMCLSCHRGETFKQKNFKPAATYCAACHR